MNTVWPSRHVDALAQRCAKAKLFSRICNLVHEIAVALAVRSSVARIEPSRPSHSRVNRKLSVC